MKRFLRGLALMFALACIAPSAHADSWTLTLQPPGGAISGTPGSTIGWGFTISNQSSTDWLMLSALSADAFQHATPDASLFSFPILAPMSSLTFPYLAGASGLAEITWDLTAPVGFVNIGAFTISAEWWDGDPLNGGNFISLAPDQLVPYSTTVTPAATAVPEPSSLLLLASSLTALAAFASRKAVRLTASRKVHLFAAISL